MGNALIIGIDSTIGRALASQLTMAGFIVYGTSRRMNHVSNDILYLDMADVSTFNISKPMDVVYICAGMTKMVSCSQDPVYSRLVNVEAPIQLARHFVRKGTHVVYLSSNAVFRGEKQKNRITDKTNPITLYGEYKALVENELLALSDTIAIVRLTKVLTHDYALILQWVDMLKKGQAIEPFMDVTLSPIPLHVVTRCLWAIAKRKLHGIIHLSGSEDNSYLDLAEYLACSLGVNKGLIQSKSILESTSAIESVPLYTSLDMTESNSLFNLKNMSLASVITGLYGYVLSGSVT